MSKLSLNKPEAGNSGRRKKYIMLAVFLCLMAALGYAAWEYGDFDLFSSGTSASELAPQPVAKIAPLAPVPPVPPVEQPASAFITPPAQPAPAVQTISAVVPTPAPEKVNPKPAEAAQPAQQQAEHPLTQPSSATTQQITELQAELEVKKLQAAIYETEQKMKQAAPALPPVMVLPPAEPSARVQVASISGFNGAFSAVLRGQSGSRTVKTGDKFEGGQIIKITPTEVHWRVSGKVSKLLVDEGGE